MDAYLEVWGGTGPALVPLPGDDASIGRAESNPVPLPADSAVSRVHAVITRYGDAWCVKDLGSTNGTYLNGQRVMSEQPLRPGDEIRVGTTRLVFRSAGTRSDSGATARVTARVPELTKRERNVLVELCRPLLGAESFAQPAGNREIGTRLYVGEAAVKFHLANLYMKFGIDDTTGSRRAQLANTAIRDGLVTRADLQDDPRS
jgi:pSer/pThr/pTyr-binding forkhead associated (FHA) protein